MSCAAGRRGRVPAWAPSLVFAGCLAASAGPAPSAKVAGPLTFHHLPEHARLVDELARTAPAELEWIAVTLGLPAPPRADVYVLPRKSGVVPESWGVPSGPGWAAGLTLGGRPVIVLRTADERPGRGGGVATVLRHELVHLVVGQALGPDHAVLPAWLREGTASELAFEWRVVDSVRALRFALGGRLLPLSRLEHGFPADPEGAADAYLESFSFVSWLVDRRGHEGLAELHRRVLAGQPFDAAFAAAQGGTVAELEREWRREFMRRHAWIPVITSATTPWLLMTLLFLAGYVRKRRRSAARMKQWEEEEALAAEADDGEGAA